MVGVLTNHAIRTASLLFIGSRGDSPEPWRGHCRLTLLVVRVIDVDDPATWTTEVKGFVDDHAARLEGTTEYTSDLRITPEEEDEFRSLLAPNPLKVYHATRLLEHELESIRIGGLVPLSADLVRSRIETAAIKGYLTEAERDDLLVNNLFDGGHEVSNREDQVAFFLSAGVLDHAVWGIRHPLTTWGGEGIYFGTFADQTNARLKLMGRPTLIVAAIDLSSGGRHLVFPGTLRSFVGRVLGHEAYESDVLYRGRPIYEDEILDIWQPGKPEYDRHSELPGDVPGALDT